MGVPTPQVSGRSKLLLLAFLAVQNSMLFVLGRWSRLSAKAGPVYAKTSFVVTCELVKIVVSFILLAIEGGTCIMSTLAEVQHVTMSQPAETAKLLVPSLLYVVQNNLVLIAADNLEGPVMAVVSQAKIPATVLFSILLLGKRIEARQWVSIALLTCGVCMVQISQMGPKKGEGDSGKKNMAIGLVAVLCACCSSGLAGVYLEKTLKGSGISVWVRNLHLAVVGACVACLAVFASEADLVMRHGFFAGYDGVVWSFVGVQAAGGLLVAAVMKYTDNILKSFASSAAIVLTCSISMAFFNFPAHGLFFVGAGGVILSIFLYGDLLRGCFFCRPCPKWLGGQGRHRLAAEKEEPVPEVETATVVEIQPLRPTRIGNTQREDDSQKQELQSLAQQEV